MVDLSLEQKAVNVIRGISMDGPHAARSGHQGTAMALAPIAHVLFSRIMRYDAADPDWADRDRFVLSCGHASILHYAMLHLTGQGLSRDDLINFRQFGSKTPGHPEADTPGIEVTTGPLGQGFANAVGLSLAERHLRARFGSELCDHHTFVLCSDGDLAEGISHESASLAGHLGLGRLVAIYDDNRITIDGATDLALSDDAAARFRSYGWDVIEAGEVGDDLDAIESHVRQAMSNEDAPSIIIVRTRVGTPSPTLTDDPAAHGYAFKDDEITATKAVLGIPDEPFWIPDDVADFYRTAGGAGAGAHAEWDGRRAAQSDDEFEACLAGTTSADLASALPSFEPGESIATRVSAEKALNAIAPHLPGLIGGSCDLTGNTGTRLAGQDAQSAAHPAGRQIYFGVREHAMGAILNGMALHGGTVPFGGTFLVFSDYMRPAIRMAALSHAKTVFVFTHDSIGVGEDGPTHQPVEQVAALRAIPGLRVIRPGDANEAAQAWRAAVEGDGPTALIMSRQGVPTLATTAENADGVAKGGYILSDVDNPAVVLAGTGSELALCVDAAALLAADGIAARVVSLPCWSNFEASGSEHQKTVLPDGVPCLGVEAGTALGWHRWADDVVAIDGFGASGPASEVMAAYGFTPANVADRARALIG